MNKNITFTGIRDKNLETVIEANGGKVFSTVSKKVDLLIANGADLTLKNNKGQTPIEYLVEKRRKDAADKLIEYLEKRHQKNTF